MKRTVQVDLGDRSYPIHISTDWLDQVGTICTDLGLGSTALVVSDGNVDPLYGQRCKDSLVAAGVNVKRAVVPAGETSKCLGQLEALYDRAVSAGLDRRSFVVALGGGVVGDLAGYLAASYLRGLTYIQVPTTIVAMTDSAVGGKTGINLPQGKNLVGSFWQPAAVWIDLGTLETLPPREFISGLAEVIKYGVIWDPDLFALLEREREAIVARDPRLLAALVGRSCEIKAEVVRQDEREGGLRAILNFGHTVGHAIEKVASYGAYLHGEAIAVGMVYAARLSASQTGLDDLACERISALLAGYGLPVRAAECAWPALRTAIGVDKKSVGAAPRFVLAERIGSVRFGCEVDEATLEATWTRMS